VKCKSLAIMSVLRKPRPTPTLVKRLNQSNVIDNDFLLNEKQHTQWQAKINRHYQFVVNQTDNQSYSYSQAIDDLISKNWLPQNYRQLHILHLMAKGIYFKPDLLAQHDIIIYDNAPQQMQRLSKQNRQPTSPYDFVLINPNDWQSYEPLQRFYKHLPNRPYCSTEKDSKALILDKDKAINLGYIQPNHPLFCHALTFDIDESSERSAFTAWQDYNLPPPNIIVKNPSKDSCHYVYLLKVPVTNAKDMTQKAVKYLDAIYERMRALLSADKSYCGSRMKNPFSTKHDTFVSGAEPYTLEQLADKLDLYTNEYWSEINAERAKPKLSIEALKRAEPSDGYLGRNHAIFENVRFIGYRNSHLTFNELYKLLLRECEQYNTEYYSNDPLQYNHLTHIARSITRFCKSERFGQYSEQSNAKFSKLQAFRANCANAKSQACNKGGRARSAKYDVKRTIANKMADQGYNNTQIALKLGVSRVSVIKWLK
jgi:hypothetical protein